jgi:predicted metal-dependent hydrolase
MNNGSLLILDRTIPYTIRISERAKRMRVAVYVDGDVVVTKPIDTTSDRLKKFVESKKYWILKKLEQRTSVIPEIRKNSSQHFERHRIDANNLVSKKIGYWAKKLGYEYTSVTVKQFKSRWGSCSSEGNLSFNYKIVFLPEDLQDYVVVHELCHTKRKDHSKYFWALVYKSLPDYSKLRIKIRSLS